MNAKFKNLHELSQAAIGFVNRHAIMAGLGVGAFLVLAGLLVFWYEVFSGYAEPIQFIYAAF